MNINIKELAETYQEQHKKGIVAIERKKSKFTSEELEQNLLEGVVFEMIRIWLNKGIDKENARIRDISGKLDPLVRVQIVSRMLNKLEEIWKVFTKRIEVKKKDEVFGNQVEIHIPQLYSLWVRNDS